MNIFFSGSPQRPVWAVGKGNHLLIFSLEGKPVQLLRPIAYNDIDEEYLFQQLITALEARNWQEFSGLIDDQPSLLNYVDEENGSILHYVCSKPYYQEAVSMLSYLLDKGADPNIQDTKGTTPLHWLSAKAWMTDPAEILLRYGADPNLPDHQGNTAYDSAVRTSFMVGDQMLRLFDYYSR